MTTGHDTVPLPWSLKVGFVAVMAFAFALAPTFGAAPAKPYFDLPRDKIAIGAANARSQCAGSALERAP